MPFSSFFFSIFILISLAGVKDVCSTGVCYGKNGNNLASESEVVKLYQANGIKRMRIYNPDQPTLTALKNSGIELILGVPNDSLRSLASAPAATSWVRKNVLPFAADVKIRYISVGNEVHPADANAQYVLPAIRNIHDAIKSANLADRIKVSTAVDTTLLAVSYPPSSGSFGASAASYIKPVIDALVANRSPLLVNVYPYFSYVGSPKSISLQYALFTSGRVVVADGGYGYSNLFDALVDSVYAALEKVGGRSVRVVVSESGWPSEGGGAATVGNAGAYYRNLISHVKGKGTPRRPGEPTETYLFAIFDENMKSAGIEQHFGVFLPNKQPKYQLAFA